MTRFRRELQRRQPKTVGERRWLFVPYDQLGDGIGPLAREDPRELGIVLIENPWKAARRPYLKAKLALVISNLRWFALEQAERGVAVRHVVANGPYRTVLEPLAAELGPLRVMEPAERELRVDLAPLVESRALEIIPHEGWLTTPQQFHDSHPQGPPWLLDRFYRHVREETGVLMHSMGPIGGRFSFDEQNRESWHGDPPAPTPPVFPLDPIKEEVAELVLSRYAPHPGALRMEAIPATRADADALWEWARGECLPWFGPYQDAMSTRSANLFHTRASALLNLHRLLPRRVLDEVLALDIPLNSKEGFVRQLLGWREFVRHVHRETDGFRSVPGWEAQPATAPTPGDAGFGRYRGERWSTQEPVSLDGTDGGFADDLLGGEAPLPPAFWGELSGLNCLDNVVRDLWREGVGHHITRLMVLANLARLLDISPRELTDWFWVAYWDAYDWVVEPNVLGISVYATGDLMATKPYISGAAYIHRMSNFCEGCRFDPRLDCPFTSLYWGFLARHAEVLKDNPRLQKPLAALERRSAAKQRRDREVFRRVRDVLAEGRELTPADLPPRPGQTNRTQLNPQPDPQMELL